MTVLRALRLHPTYRQVAWTRRASPPSTTRSTTPWTSKGQHLYIVIALNIKRSALVHSNCPSSHLFERVCLWAGLLHHLYIIIAPPICLSVCVCGLDSSNPRALSAKDILILFPSTEQGGWVLVKRLVSANKKTCRLGFAMGCTWCHKAHRPVTFEWLLIFFRFFFSPPPCFLLYVCR